MMRKLPAISALLAGVVTGTVLASLSWCAAAVVAEPAKAAKPAISPEASAALLRIGETLRSKEFSLEARTIRIYADPRGEQLHIFHTRRPPIEAWG
jgi:hypothetical protein